MKKIFILVLALSVFFGFSGTAHAANKVDPPQPCTLIDTNVSCSQVVCTINGKPFCCTTTDQCSSQGGAINSSDKVTCDNGTGIQTAIGCIHALSTPDLFFADILRWAVGIGGGIAFLLIIYAGFMIMTASGSPERLKAGQELLTSAISGLILLVFSIFILKFIGVDILGLCKFGFGKCPEP